MGPNIIYLLNGINKGKISIEADNSIIIHDRNSLLPPKIRVELPSSDGPNS